ncbi:transcription/translation regulatory transformer protein RfaH [Propionivibrio sp.]|uniref:transcription/translation regulatory transformer protein RfaH n=1 Tax=Propionivibrio sp. TaxID=2212460 RepID=UPI0025F6F027|nr:transcription/translation regulatory transformer protein RfaH [Propionivibrio sp.]
MISPTKPGQHAEESGWYVVYTRPRQEARALENLRNQGFVCFLPTLSAERLRGGRQVEIAEALFPRYLFVYLEVGRSNWSTIRSTRGVVKLVEFGGVAARIPEAFISALAEQPTQQKKLFEVGERLKVIDGPFVGIETELVRLYRTSDGEARVIVLMELLMRPQQVSLPVCAVRKAA